MCAKHGVTITSPTIVVWGKTILSIHFRAPLSSLVHNHYRTRSIYRVQIDLPSAFCRTLSKGNLCREPDPAALGKDRPSANMPLPRAAVGKKIQNLAVGKGGRRDGGHLPSAFAECPDVRLSAKIF